MISEIFGSQKGASIAHGVLRIAAALAFISHGTMKLFGFPVVPEFGQPDLLSLGGAAGVIEVFAGGLVLIGLFTRPAAFLCSGTMAVAYWMVHGPQNFVPALNGGEAAYLFCFVFLWLSFAGPGAFAVDNVKAGEARKAQ